ncbi:putative tagatose-6-phosphate ketose/aldose isomerase [compost metagenome]
MATVELADQLLPESYHLMLVCNPDSQLAQYAHQRDNVCSLVMPQGSNDQSFAMTSGVISRWVAVASPGWQKRLR